MIHRIIQTTQSSMIAVLLISNSLAAPGPAPNGTALAEYNWQTGEITVSINGVNNWYIESVSSSFTGATSYWVDRCQYLGV